AALRSIGSFHITHDHIAFNYPPDSIHRDIIFRRIELNKPGVYTNFEIRLLSREGSISSPHLMAVELSVWRSPSLSTILSSVSSHPDGVDTRKSPSSSSSSSLASSSSKEAGYSDYSVQQDIDFFVKLETDALNTSVYVCPAACHSPPIPVT
uniref:Arrestin_N domain-containing protein n=1 Tax=Trichobilharzia regenti TaxID=157069 RepID=A0AA85J941_TRIRE